MGTRGSRVQVSEIAAKIYLHWLVSAMRKLR